LALFNELIEVLSAASQRSCLYLSSILVWVAEMEKLWKMARPERVELPTAWFVA